MPNIFGAVGAVKADLVAYNKLTTGLRHDLQIFAQISEFRCFHETKQAENEVERFFPQLGRICFRILLRQSENFSDFYKVLSQFAFCNMIVSFYTSSSACALKLPSISHTCFFDTKLYKPLPLFAFFCTYEVAQSPHENSMRGANTRSVLARFGDNNWEKGEDFVKTFYVKKLVWEMEGSLSVRALDDV